MSDTSNLADEVASILKQHRSAACGAKARASTRAVDVWKRLAQLPSTDEIRDLRQRIGVEVFGMRPETVEAATAEHARRYTQAAVPDCGDPGPDCVEHQGRCD